MNFLKFFLASKDKIFPQFDLNPLDELFLSTYITNFHLLVSIILP